MNRPWLLLLLIPALLGILLARRFRLPANRSRLLLAMRILTCITIVVAIAGPLVESREAQNLAVMVVDTSKSIGSASASSAQMFKALSSVSEDIPVAIVNFDSEARLALNFNQALDSYKTNSYNSKNTTSDETNIASGIRMALGIIPQQNTKAAIMLVTDAEETKGSALAASAEARERGIKIYGVAPVATGKTDLRVESVFANSKGSIGAPVIVETVVSASLKSRGELVLRRLNPTVEITKKILSFPARQSMRVILADPNPPTGTVRYELSITALGVEDEFRANDSAPILVEVNSRAKIMVINKDGAKNSSGIPEFDEMADFQYLTPKLLSRNAEQLLSYKNIVIEPCPRAAFDTPLQSALTEYVKLGGGLIMLGGPNALGAGGWRDEDKLSEVLPISFEPQKDDDASFVLIVDTSGSMATQAKAGVSRLEVVRTAITAFLRSSVLSPDDEIAIIGFSDTANILLKPSKLRDVKDWRPSENLRAGGETSLSAGLQATQIILQHSGAKRRGAMLLSDGEPTSGLRGEALLKMAEQIKTQGGRLHVLGTSDNPKHRELLTNLAARGGGELAFQTDFTQLKKTFSNLGAVARGRYLREGKIQPVEATDTFAALLEVGRLPNFGGMNRTKLKEFGALSLRTVSSEPLLSFAKVGLGTSCVFSAWGGEFETSNMRELLWKNIFAVTRPQPNDERFVLNTMVENNRNKMELIAKEENGESINLLTLSIEYVALTQNMNKKFLSEHKFTQVGLGRYQTTAPSVPSIARVIRHEGEERRVVLRVPVMPQRSPELIKIGTNQQALAQIANASGGRVLKSAAEFSTLLEDLDIEEQQDVGHDIAIASICLILLELSVRLLARKKKAT